MSRQVQDEAHDTSSGWLMNNLSPIYHQNAIIYHIDVKSDPARRNQSTDNRPTGGNRSTDHRTAGGVLEDIDNLSPFRRVLSIRSPQGHRKYLPTIYRRSGLIYRSQDPRDILLPQRTGCHRAPQPTDNRPTIRNNRPIRSTEADSRNRLIGSRATDQERLSA